MRHLSAISMVACLAAAAASSGGGQTGPATTAPATPTTAPATPTMDPRTPTTGPATMPADANAPADTRDNLRQLWRENLRPPETAESARLRAIMEELRRMHVAPVRRSKMPAEASAAPEAANQPAATQPASPVLTVVETQPAPIRTLPEKVIAQLKSLPAAGLSRPAELADELYRGGYLGAALAVYELALKQEADGETKAWALYQMANCRRVADPDEAAKLYLRVTGEHPQCPWAEPAGVELKLLEWHRVNRPLELLGRIRQVGRGPTSRPTTQPSATGYPNATDRVLGGPTVAGGGRQRP